MACMASMISINGVGAKISRRARILRGRKRRGIRQSERTAAARKAVEICHKYLAIASKSIMRLLNVLGGENIAASAAAAAKYAKNHRASTLSPWRDVNDDEAEMMSNAVLKCRQCHPIARRQKRSAAARRRRLIAEISANQIAKTIKLAKRYNNRYQKPPVIKEKRIYRL